MLIKMINESISRYKDLGGDSVHVHSLHMRKSGPASMFFFKTNLKNTVWKNKNEKVPMKIITIVFVL